MEERDDTQQAPEEELREELDFEPEEELGTVGAAQAKLKKIKAELEKVKAERAEYLDGWQRCKTDSVNARKELLEDAKRQATRSQEAMLEELLPVLDSFDMAAGSSAWNTVDAQWRNGIEHIRNQLLEVIQRNGFERFGAVGEMSNPYQHEAVQETADGEGKSGEIVRVLRYGYKIGERIIRPAQVVVKA